MDFHLKQITLSFFLSSALLCAATENVTSIKYEGMVHISQAVANQLNEVKVGEPLDPQRLDKAIKTFFDQGYFEDVWAEEEAGVVTFHFKEKPIISKIELKGFKENDEEAQKGLLQIDKGALYDIKRIESAKKRIMDALNQEGKIDSVVEVETTKLDNGSLSVKFIANEGEEIIIKELKYYGVSGLDADEFDTVIANKERDFMGWMWGRNDGKMKIAELQYDPFRIHDYYMQFGYLNAKIDAPFVAVDFNRYEAKITYNVFEGDIFRVSDILIFQDTAVIEDQALLDVIALSLIAKLPLKSLSLRRGLEILNAILLVRCDFSKFNPTVIPEPKILRSLIAALSITPPKLPYPPPNCMLPVGASLAWTIMSIVSSSIRFSSMVLVSK